MSGIVGIYHLRQPLDASNQVPNELENMVQAIAHRGPDGIDTWHDGSIGLGHLMLQSTPESLLETLPLQCGHLSITADARIDNRDELLARLRGSDCSHSDLSNVVDLSRPDEKITDSEIILAAYDRWGEDCTNGLLGAFAFAIWDNSSQHLFCARDHFGVKPFYYYHQPGELFAFASEIKALLCLPQVPKQINEVRIADYLTMTMGDKSVTTFEDILRLAPAHYMTVSASQHETQCYWMLDPDYELQLDSDEAYAQAFHDIFSEAVKCRLRSAFPVISQLSGGLDSSSVTCVAREIITKSKGQKLHTLSTIFDKVSECDERPFINAVLAGGDLIPHYIHGDETSPLAEVEAIFQYEDEAYLGPSHFYPWIANKAAHDLGMRVVLDGFDGDTTVSHGVMRLVELAHQGNWEALLEEAKAVSENHPISHYAVIQKYGLPHLHELLRRGRWIKFFKVIHCIHKTFSVSRKNLFVKHGIQPLLKQLNQQDKHELKDQTLLPNSLLDRAFAERIQMPDRIRSLSNHTNELRTLREKHWQGLTQGIYAFTLEQVDRYAACFGLEARHPFMDKRLIEFCLALPAEQKLAQGFGRVVMRRALEGILPTEVQWRPRKTSLAPNFDYGFLNSDRHILEEVMTKKIELLDNYINANVLQSAYQRMLAVPEKIDNEDCMTVWKAVILALSLEDKQRKLNSIL